MSWPVSKIVSESYFTKITLLQRLDIHSFDAGSSVRKVFTVVEDNITKTFPCNIHMCLSCKNGKKFQ